MDNGPKHTVKVPKQWLNVHVANFTSDFPPQSPDLNPIENIWSVVADKVAEKSPKKLETLKKLIREVCFSIPREYILHAIDSMDARCSEVIINQGGHTKYWFSNYISI